MKQLILASVLALASGSVAAKGKVVPLSAADAQSLRGKTVAMTVHDRPSFSAMTAGKAGFGLLGAAGMIAAGNKLIDENSVEDPAVIVRTQLANALQQAYGATLLPVDTAPTKAKKPKDLAATHPEADYVFDVRSGGWMYAYYPTQWATYWVGYSVQAQLIDTKTGRQVSNAACNTNTRDNKHPPSRDDLHGDGAKLLKAVTAGLGWTCVQLLAKEQFALPADMIAATPAEFADPLAARVASIPTQPAAPTASAIPVAAVDVAPATTSDAAPAPAQAPEETTSDAAPIAAPAPDNGPAERQSR